ncbi:MAG: HlyD family efflux transporter periplasmic adaptor subunit [Oscillospiraceae bacterium]|nr:HlyD family efflux transporter periplasmic adaptor subunit [Oscillospiraceae bacterium]
MAEVLDRNKQTPDKPAEAPAAAVPAEAAGAAFAPAAPATNKKKKRSKRKLVRRIVVLAVALALVAAVIVWRSTRQDGGASEVLTEMVSRGSITSMVEGSGAAVAKNSASITLLSGGQVLEIYVAEGDYVHEGDALYTIESKDAQERVNSEQKNVNNLKKQLAKLYEAANDLNVRADYDGILLNVASCPVGETVVSGTTVATLVDNTKLLLPLYFSYAYEGEIAVGQEAEVSVPATMARLPGTVHEIHKVQRVSAEGGRLFEVVVAVDNPGTLTEQMTATATLAGAETIYPYAAGELQWFRSKALKTEITGECAWNSLYDYMPVSAGQSVLTLTAESSDDEISTLETQLRNAEKTLEEAQKNLDSLNAFAPIDGTVLTVGITAGEEAKTGTVAMSIADTTTMIVNASIDEMNVSYAKVGMPVNIDLWGNGMIGTIDSVSLSAKAENGVARFPIVISVDNSDGVLMSGAYVNYSFTASQSDDCLIVPIQCVKSAQTADGESVKVLFVRSDVPPENTAELAMELTDVPEGFYPVVVETGISDNYNVELLSGVEEGVTVYSGVAQNNGMGMYF